jgi:hypothetical protein
VNHIELLHAVTEQTMGPMLERYIGPDWERRIDALNMLREEQKQIVLNEAHGVHIDPDGQPIPFWGGVRQSDEHSCAVGYYMPFPNEDDSHSVAFRPVAAGLDRHYAEQLSRVVAEQLQQHPDDQLALYQQTIQLLLDEGHDDIEPPGRTVERTFDMDL